MRVVCDNCGASYRIPDHKLVKEVNKATCRKCGEAIIIRRSAGMAVGDQQKEVDPDAATQVTEASSLTGPSSGPKDKPVASIPSGPSMGHGFGQPAQLPEDAGPPTVAQHMDFKDETIPRQDLPEPTAATPQAPPSFEPAPSTSSPAQTPSAQPPPTPAPARPPTPKKRSRSDRYDPSGDLTVVMMSNFACAAGALFIVVAQDAWHRPMGLFVCMAGAILSLSVVITSDRGTKPSSMLMSYLVSFVVAGAAAFGLYTYEAPPSAPSVMVQAKEEPSQPALEEVVALEGDEEEDATGEDGADSEDEAQEEDAPPPAAPTRSTSAGRSTPAAVSGTGAFPSGGSRERAPVAPSPPKEDDNWDDDWDDDWDEPASPPPPPPRQREPEPEPEPEPVLDEPASEGVPLAVLDTMLRNNRNVKVCFVNYSRETGSMPSGRINVRLKVLPSGLPTNVGITGGPYAGTSLDSCLAGAITGIRFPPFGGDSKTYTYPFVL